MSSLRVTGILALAAVLWAAGPALAQDMDFTAAKAAADTDEASLTGTARDAALTQQRRLLEDGVAACADTRTTARLEAFVVVVALDATGQIVRTWRRGDSPLALCIERHVRGKSLFVPPRAPFHASLEVSFEL